MRKSSGCSHVASRAARLPLRQVKGMLGLSTQLADFELLVPEACVKLGTAAIRALCNFSCQKTNLSRTKHASLTAGANPGLRCKSRLGPMQEHWQHEEPPRQGQGPMVYVDGLVTYKIFPGHVSGGRVLHVPETYVRRLMFGTGTHSVYHD